MTEARNNTCLVRGRFTLRHVFRVKIAGLLQGRRKGLVRMESARKEREATWEEGGQDVAERRVLVTRKEGASHEKELLFQKYELSTIIYH